MNDSVDICICTFRRPHLAQTLGSLAEIDVPDGMSVCVIVADNDETPSAQDLVTGAELPFELKYVHAPARNISIARNACLDAATAGKVVFIDDDELVSRHWLTELVATHNETQAEIVIGPAISIYPETAPDWIKEGDYHSSRATYDDGRIKTAYTCNVLLLRESPFVRDERFQLDLGQSGGEDTVFFSKICARGAKIAYAAEAVVTEGVSPDRLSMTWLLKRKFRFGQTHALTILDGDGLALKKRLGLIPGAAAKSAFCLSIAAISVTNASKWRKWLIRSALHAGVVSKCLGLRSPKLYG